MLNFKEKIRLKNAFKSFKDKKNITIFIEMVDKILDTKAKRTLWFDIIPLLEEDDQEYAKRKLCLNNDFLKEIKNENRKNNNLNFASSIYEPGHPDLYLSIDQKHANSEHTYGLIDADFEKNFENNEKIQHLNRNSQAKLV